MSLLLEVSHGTRYDYAAPVSLAHHLAHLQPLDDAHQSLLAFDLAVDPPPEQHRDSTDAHGNAQRHFSLSTSHDALNVRALSRVRVRPRFAGLRPEASPAWDTLASGLRYVARGPFVPQVEFAVPSPFVPRLRELRDFASLSFTAGRPIAAVALELMHRVHEGFRYESRSTEIDTPLASVMQHRRGVCQDFAHLLIGMLRMFGVPARYVSGYLVTRAPDGDEAAGRTMLGADASHAWVQAWCPGTPGVPAEGAAAGWLDLDPTNDLVPGSAHVRVATGRDYGDVTPLRGVIRGGGRHTLSVGVTLRPLAEAPVGPVTC